VLQEGGESRGGGVAPNSISKEITVCWVKGRFAFVKRKCQLEKEKERGRCPRTQRGGGKHSLEREKRGGAEAVEDTDLGEKKKKKKVRKGDSHL